MESRRTYSGDLVAKAVEIQLMFTSLGKFACHQLGGSSHSSGVDMLSVSLITMTVSVAECSATAQGQRTMTLPAIKGPHEIEAF